MALPLATFADAVTQYAAAGGTGTPVAGASHSNNGRATWVLRTRKGRGGLLAYAYQDGRTVDRAWRDMVAPETP